MKIVNNKNIDVIIAAITWLAIILQSLASKNMANTFSYFTVLTNLLIAISLSITILLPETKISQFFTKAVVQSSLTSYIIIVCIIYNFAIRSSWIEPVPKVIYNNILHVLTPILYLLRWIIYVPKGKLLWYDSIKSLVYPFTYLIYTLIRGELVNWYPYFFIDLRYISYLEASINILLVITLFILFGSLLISIDKIIHKKSLLKLRYKL